MPPSRLWGAAASLVCLTPAPAWAGYPPPVAYAPQLLDPVGVDIQSRLPAFSILDLAIGAGGHGLSHVVQSTEGAFVPWDLADSFRSGLSTMDGCGTAVGNGAEGGCFRLANERYSPIKQDGSTLVKPAPNLFVYTDRQGRITQIDTTRIGLAHNVNGGVATSISAPDGFVIRLNWDTFRTASGGLIARLLTASTNTGYAMKYEYASDTFDLAGNDIGGTNWATLVKVTAYNRAYQTCADSALHCPGLTKSRSSSYTLTSFGRYVGYRFVVQDASGKLTSFGLDPTFRVSAYKPADSPGDRIRYVNCRASTFPAPNKFVTNYGEPCYINYNNGLSLIDSKTDFVYSGVKWVEKDGDKWIYSPNLSIGGCGCYFANTSKRPDGTVVKSVLSQSSLPTSMLVKASTPDEAWSFVVDTPNRVASYTRAGAGTVTYTYDARGNVTQARTSAPGSADVVVSATYPATCSSNAICNKALSVTDPNGATTEFSYDPTHGGMLTETGPADRAGVRPQKRTAYIQRQAVYINDTGALISDVAPIWLVSRESVCRTSSMKGPACAAGAADEVVTTYDYGPTTGPNNLLLRGVAVTADGVTQRTCFGYNEFGDRISETRPDANLASCP